MKKAFYFICLSALLLPTQIWANDGTEHAHKGPNAAVRKYVKEQVMPVLIQKRQQFDKELNTTEKNEITECRAALKQLRQQHKNEARPEQKNAGSDDMYYGQQRPEHKASPEFEQRKAIMEKLQTIAEKHSNSLQDIKTQLEPARKQWMTDIKALMPAPANSDDKAAGEPQQKWHHPGFGPEGFIHGHHLGAQFLLLPTNLSDVTDETEGELKADFIPAPASPAAAAAGLTSFTLMPNPASNDLQLGNDVLPATNVLKVIDLQGKEVMTLENVTAAQHLDVTQLASGTYLVQIKSGDQTVSKKVVITK
jgi:hypothetical protein